eukprot:403354-Pelagomonas_calceolata.AAC.1
MERIKEDEENNEKLCVCVCVCEAKGEAEKRIEEKEKDGSAGLVAGAVDVPALCSLNTASAVLPQV